MPHTCASGNCHRAAARLHDGNWSFAIVADFTDADACRACDQDEEHNRTRAGLLTDDGADRQGAVRDALTRRSGPAPRSIWQDVGSYPSGLGRKPVPVRFQLVIDCADPDRLARFWAAALGYELAPALPGFATWNDFYREQGVPEEELAGGADRISDPQGHGPGIWFHAVPEGKRFEGRRCHGSRTWSIRHASTSRTGTRATRRPVRLVTQAAASASPV